MTTPKPERAIDVFDIEVALASRGETSGLAFRFHLRDGSTLVFVLPEQSASQLAIRIQERLAELRQASPSTRKQ